MTPVELLAEMINLIIVLLLRFFAKLGTSNLYRKLNIENFYSEVKFLRIKIIIKKYIKLENQSDLVNQSLFYFVMLQDAKCLDN